MRGIGMIAKGLTFDDVLLVPGYNHIESRKDVSTNVRLGSYHFSLPIISANMDTITGVEMAQAIGSLGGLPILYRPMGGDTVVDDYREATRLPLVVGVSIGVNARDVERLYAAGARIFCLDVAHAHSKLVGKTAKALRAYPYIFLIIGNVATYAAADYLASVGADAVKVGIGAGSVCTTREKTGFGVPQLSAIMDCSRVGIPIIADGGMRHPGDIVKALAAGASMVMLGGMLAGTDEARGKQVYRGMASAEAQEDYFGAIADWRTAEGITIDVPQRGPVENVIKDIEGGLRSGLTYAGVRNIEELHHKATFIEVTNSSMIEGGTTL